MMSARYAALEQGFVLISSLMILVVLTLLATSAINAALLQQRMASHRLQILKSSRSAEAALHAAHRQLARTNWHVCVHSPDEDKAGVTHAPGEECQALLREQRIQSGTTDHTNFDEASTTKHASPTQTPARGRYTLEWLPGPDGYSSIRFMVTAQSGHALHSGTRRVLQAQYQLQPPNDGQQRPVVRPVSWREVQP